MIQPALWVNLYADDLFRFALYRIADETTCEDLVQETFLSALKARSQFKGDSTEKTWLYSILKNKIVDYYRRKGKFQMKEIVSDTKEGDVFFDSDGKPGHWMKTEAPSVWEDAVDQSIEQEEYRKTLLDCIAKLSPQQAEILQDKYYEEKKSDQICKELGISKSNYWVLLHRMNLQLRKCLEINWFRS